MPEYPAAPCIRAAIAWNDTERKRALKDSTDSAIKVPANAVKMVRDSKIQISADEYRESRAKDAQRHAINVQHLKGLL